jgi:hypothetical protein
MKKNLIIIFIISTSFSLSFAQDEEKMNGELFLAPDFGLMLGTINRIEFSPALGYYLTDRFCVAGGFKYEFYSETRLYTYQSAIKTNIYGPRVFAQYTIFRNLGDFLPVGSSTGLFTHIEFESSSLEKRYFYYPYNPEKGRFWYHTILVGGGFSQAVSDKINLNILVLWDTSGGSISLYNNPVIRFGFQFFLRPKMEEVY